MTLISMSRIDKLLDLRRGTANSFRRRGLFSAIESTNGFMVDDADFPGISELILSQLIQPEGTITVEETALRLVVALPTVYNLVRNHRILGVRVGKRLYIDVDSVEKYRVSRVPPGMTIHQNRKGRR